MMIEGRSVAGPEAEHREDPRVAAAAGVRGELVQWDTSEHDWLEGRGEKLYLINMIDDATSRVHGALCAARFDRRKHASAVDLSGAQRPAASILHRQGESVSNRAEDRSGSARNCRRDEREPLPPTQIGRALRELGIVWIAAHSPQAKGRVERSFKRRRIGW